MNEAGSAPRPASPWRPDIFEPAVLVVGTLVLLAVLGMRIHPFPAALKFSVMGGGAMAALVYLVRSLGLLVRRFSDPEATRELGSGIALGGGLIMVSLLLALVQVPPDLDRRALLNDLETQRTLALMGKDLPSLKITERRYREAYPLMKSMRELAERTSQASADFQRTAVYAKSPFTQHSLGTPEGRKEAKVRLESLRSTVRVLEEEAQRLVGPGFVASLGQYALSDDLRQQVEQATTHNRQFNDCLEWIDVNRTMMDRIQQAYALAERHLILAKGFDPVWDGPGTREAFRRLEVEIRALADRTEVLRQRTRVSLVDDPR